MSRMFRRIHWQLVAWTMLVVGTILLGVGLTVYFALSRGLVSQVDRNLALRADQVAENPRAIPGGDQRALPRRRLLPDRQAGRPAGRQPAARRHERIGFVRLRRRQTPSRSRSAARDARLRARCRGAAGRQGGPPARP